MKILLRKHKGNGKIEFDPVYFNSLTKTVILQIFPRLMKGQRKLINKDWINGGSGWMIESVDAEYVNISIYSPLSRSICIELPRKLKNSLKDLINIKKNDNKFFL